MGVARADHCRRQTVSASHVATEGEVAVGKDGAFEGETGAHVRTGAVTGSGRTGDERRRPGEIMILLLGGKRIVEYSQDGAIGNGAQRPLPIIVIGKTADRTELHRAQKRTQSDVDTDAGAGTQPDLLAKRGQEGRSTDFQSVEAGQKAGRGVMSSFIGEDG